MHKQLLPLLPSKRGRYGLSKGIASLGTILFAALLVWGSTPKENAMPSLSPRLMTTALTAEATVPETETAVDPDSLTVNVSSITTTDLTESFTVSFATQVVTYKNYSRYSNVYLQCTADDFDYESLPEYTEESITNLVERIIDSQLADGYFRECPITFRDIALAKQTLIERLKNIYHTRISYPELQKNEEEVVEETSEKEEID